MPKNKQLHKNITRRNIFIQVYVCLIQENEKQINEF